MEKQLNKPQLRFPEFMGEWKKKKFGEEIKDYGYGPRFNGEDYSFDGNVKTIRGTDISINGEIKYEQVPLALLDDLFIKNHILEDGDLIMITTADCGLTGVFRKQDISYIPSAYAVKIKLKDSSNPYYFKYVFQTQLAKNQVNRFIRKATVANLPGSDILRFDFFIPLKDEQTKISSFLNVVDEKLQALKRTQDLLIDYKNGVRQKLFSQELRFKDENGNEFPKWSTRKIGDCLEYEQPTNYLVSSTEYSDKYSTPVVTAGKTFILGYTDEISGIFSNGLPVIIFDDFTTATQFIDFPFKAKSSAMKILKAKEKADIKFMYEALQMINYETGAHGRHWISVFAEMEILIPDYKEQIKISDFLSAIDTKIDSVNSLLVQTENWKKGLLQKMFC
jgi:type I restriction enzyme S subunit